MAPLCADPARSHSQPFSSGVFPSAGRTDIQVFGITSQPRVRFGFERRPDFFRPRFEIAVMIGTQDMNHLMLESIFDFFGKNFMIFAADFYKAHRWRVCPRDKHSV